MDRLHATSTSLGSKCVVARNSQFGFETRAADAYERCLEDDEAELVSNNGDVGNGGG